MKNYIMTVKQNIVVEWKGLTPLGKFTIFPIIVVATIIAPLIFKEWE